MGSSGRSGGSTGFSELDEDGVDTTVAVVVVVEKLVVLEVVVAEDIGGTAELEALTEAAVLVEAAELLENGGALLSGGVTLSVLLGMLIVCVEDDPAELPGFAELTGSELPAEPAADDPGLLSPPVEDTSITGRSEVPLHPETLPHIIKSDIAAARSLALLFI